MGKIENREKAIVLTVLNIHSWIVFQDNITEVIY